MAAVALCPFLPDVTDRLRQVASLNPKVKKAPVPIRLNDQERLYCIVQGVEVKIFHDTDTLSIFFGVKEFYFLAYAFVSPANKLRSRLVSDEYILNVGRGTRLKVTATSQPHTHSLQVVIADKHDRKGLLLHPRLAFS